MDKGLKGDPPSKSMPARGKGGGGTGHKYEVRKGSALEFMPNQGKGRRNGPKEGKGGGGQVVKHHTDGVKQVTCRLRRRSTKFLRVTKVTCALGASQYNFWGFDFQEMFWKAKN